MTNTTGCCYSL